MASTIHEYIIEFGEKLLQVDDPVFNLVEFYCSLNAISQFKELYPAIGKLTKQYGTGTIYNSIIKNFYIGISQV